MCVNTIDIFDTFTVKGSNKLNIILKIKDNTISLKKLIDINIYMFIYIKKTLLKMANYNTLKSTQLEEIITIKYINNEINKINFSFFGIS